MRHSKNHVKDSLISPTFRFGFRFEFGFSIITTTQTDFLVRVVEEFDEMGNDGGRYGHFRSSSDTPFKQLIKSLQASPSDENLSKKPRALLPPARPRRPCRSGRSTSGTATR